MRFIGALFYRVGVVVLIGCAILAGLMFYGALNQSSTGGAGGYLTAILGGLLLAGGFAVFYILSVGRPDDTQAAQPNTTPHPSIAFPLYFMDAQGQQCAAADHQHLRGLVAGGAIHDKTLIWNAETGAWEAAERLTAYGALKPKPTTRPMTGFKGIVSLLGWGALLAAVVFGNGFVRAAYNYFATSDAPSSGLMAHKTQTPPVNPSAVAEARMVGYSNAQSEAADQYRKYEIKLTDGRKLLIEADSQETAIAGAQHFLKTEAASGTTRDPSAVGNLRSPTATGEPYYLDQATSDFVRNVLVNWSSPNARALKAMEASYESNVVYFGKTMPLQAVLEDKRRFAQRWPQRAYSIRPGTLAVECVYRVERCTLSGTMEWTTTNAEKRSTGAATFQYVVGRGADGTLKIEEETSKVVEGPNISALVLGNRP
jgi:hypothetical protein